MAVTFQNSVSATVNGTTVSVSLDVGAGSDRVLYAAHHAPGASTGATYNSVSMSNIKLQNNLDVFELASPASGSNTLSVSNSSYTRQYLVAAAFNGVDQIIPSGTPTGQSSSGVTKSTPSTTCPTDGMVYGAMGHGYTSGGAAAISGAGNTLASSYRNGGTGQGIAGGYRSATGQVSWTTSSSTSYDAVGVPINAAASGGGGVVGPLLNSAMTDTLVNGGLVS